MGNAHSLPISNPAPNQYTSQSRPPNDTRRTNFAHRLVLAMLSMFFLISAISCVVWLVLHPQDPVFRVNSLSVSNFTLSNSQLTAANYKIELTVTNPNQKIDLSIEPLQISVRYKRISLSSNTTLNDSFELGNMSSRTLTPELHTKGVQFRDRTAEDMVREWRNGVIYFVVKMEVGTRYRATAWPSKQRSMEVTCDKLKVEFSSDKVTGKFVNGRMDLPCRSFWV
ncbi:hypothetical protein L1049_013074 [Liquidambar formosana]|uniref:Late embryogenesis abundant protein LEA-2 subgroup domain-containing protein n=1 Tax=Liquidambar formosana TaxID=63359 RepID=A0AAP0RNC4_LIQFO